MANVIDITLRARGGAQVKREIDNTTWSVQQMQRAFGQIAGTLGIAGFSTGIVSAIRHGIRWNATIEQNTLAFQTLLGSMTEARRRMEDLRHFARTTPFDLPEVIEASRVLQALTDGALASGDALRLVGDAAAAAGRNFPEVAMWVGRVYAGLRSGTPIGEATLRLIEMGLITGRTKAELEELAKTTHDHASAMRALEGAFGGAMGAMEAQSASFNGQVNALNDALGELSAILTRPIFDQLKRDMEAFTRLIDGLNQKLGGNLGRLLNLIYDAGTGRLNTLRAPFTLLERRLINEAEARQRQEEENFVDLGTMTVTADLPGYGPQDDGKIDTLSEEAYWLGVHKREYEEQNRLLAQQAEEHARIREIEKERAVEISALHSFHAQLAEQTRVLYASLGTSAQNAASIITGTMGSAFRSISENISGLILATQTWGDALANIGREILTTLVQSVVQFFVSYMARRVMAAVFGTAVAASEAAALSAIWAGPAILASIASSGAAAALGPPAVTAALASAPAIAAGASVAGFAAGGYTGDMSASAPAGIVHGREFVFSAPAVQAIGLPALESAHSRALSGGGGDSAPMRVVIVDDRRTAEEMRRDPRFRSMIVDLMETRS